MGFSPARVQSFNPLRLRPANDHGGPKKESAGPESKGRAGPGASYWTMALKLSARCWALFVSEPRWTPRLPAGNVASPAVALTTPSSATAIALPEMLPVKWKTDLPAFSSSAARSRFLPTRG